MAMYDIFLFILLYHHRTYWSFLRRHSHKIIVTYQGYLWVLLETFCKVYRKTLVLEYLFNKVAGVKTVASLRKVVFHCNLRNFSKNLYVKHLYATNIYFFRVEEMCSKLTIKTPEQHQWHQRLYSGVFNVKLEHISNLFQVLLT